MWQSRLRASARRVCVLAAALTGVVAMPAMASAATLYVGGPSPTKGCSSTAYSSVQSAVDAASSGDTVYLCGTTSFGQQVIVDKSLTLTGDAGATIDSPASFSGSASGLPSQFASDGLSVPESILTIWGAGVNVRVSGLTIQGPLPGNGGCADNEFGVLVIGGANATLSGDSVLNIRDSNSALYGCQFGVAIQVGREYWPTAGFANFDAENFVGTAAITNTTVTGYQKNGITVDGPGSRASIQNDTVTGGGTDGDGGADPVLSGSVAQNGIQISRGAGGTVKGNTISDNQYTGSAPYASSSGVIVYGGCGDPLVTGVNVHQNTLTNNDVGIYLNNYDPTCSTATSAPTDNSADSNTISNQALTNQSGFADCFGNVYTAYQAGIDDVGNGDQILKNTIFGEGYEPAQTIPGGPFVAPIDTQTCATTATVHRNVTR